MRKLQRFWQTLLTIGMEDQNNHSKNIKVNHKQYPCTHYSIEAQYNAVQ